MKKEELEKWNLTGLIDPSKYQEKVDISGYSSELLINMLKSMILIRLAEEKLAEQREIGSIGGPVHLSAGQEAIAVGVSLNLLSTDRIFGAHRSHSHVLALEPCSYQLFAEVLGKDTGLSRGMGGSMHLINKRSGFFGSAPIVSGTVPLAVGASFDSLRNGSKDLGVVYIGDGAMEEGVVHESLNLASILSTPTLFVIENNLFASHLHISLRQKIFSTARFAEANNIEYAIIDGNNIIEVYELAKNFTKDSRNKSKPKFIEAITYRHYGHVDWRKDIDVGVNRSQDDLDNWMKRDPISRLKESLIENSVLTLREINELSSDIQSNINSDWERAMQDPYPEDSALLSRVYSNE